MSRRNGGSHLSPAQVAVEVARLGDLDATALRALWPVWFKASPPARMQRTTLALALAYRIQAMTTGDLSKASARALDAIAVQEFGDATEVPVAVRRHKTGTKLVREYRGVVHEVAVVNDGFDWNGVRYRSLSAIARAITGTRWNGLVFFGLKATRTRSPPAGAPLKAAHV